MSFRFKLDKLGLALDMALTFYTSVVKRLKLKVRKFWGLIPSVVEAAWETPVEVASHRPPSWIELKFPSLGSDNLKAVFFIFRRNHEKYHIKITN